ncbi:amino acid permease [Bacillus subtilis]
MNLQENSSQQLKRTMKSRHLFMISLGGVIGTGLFLSTGYTLHQAGPGGTILAYVIGGLMMYLVMQCLGELSVAMPVTGSFQKYATTFIGPSTGFMVGIMYWINWVVTVGSEFTASGILMQRWFPDSSVWMWSAIFAALLFICNAFSVKLFAETEFWFSSVKIVTIILFIILGGAAMFGLISLNGTADAPMLSNFTDHGGLFPNGFLAVFIAMISVSFAFSGTELIGVTAGESANPQKDIPRSIRNVAWRTVIFFIGAVFVLSGLISWKDAGVIESPFVAVFAEIGIPYAADIMNFVILTALLSVANSGLYASTRMMWSLANENMISPRFKKVTSKGIPLNALMISMAVSCLSLVSSIVAPGTVYVVMVAIAGFAGVVVWMSIALSQLLFRKRFLKKGGNVKDLTFRTPLYPLMPIAALLLCSASCIGLAFDPNQRIALFCGVPCIILCYLIYHFKRNVSKAKKISQEEYPADHIL